LFAATGWHQKQFSRLQEMEDAALKVILYIPGVSAAVGLPG
jgi:hypothetical protein